ncbi:methyl-accepting chemotaxis protein [Paenibacillus xerothermodurans]|uniref:Methyl-accepting chemotaxis protein n=1 Tax=Paenibacillus xerothermodurans TaxID=1977292 RepID=A0A2W1N7J7_PAEXE|nr:methyl-accepting chemotaxis protein [Paenibacillus xerothermodurans]PZE20589.1 methyl-accepting chemotaxis protein [Paenibacillus xerothermodurans]
MSKKRGWSSGKWKGSWQNSIKTKLVVLFLLISLIPLLATTLILTEYSKRTTTAKAQEKQTSIVQSNASNIEYWVNHKITVVQEIMAAHPEFKNGDAGQILSVLKQIGEVDKEIEYYAYVDANANSTNWAGQTSNVAQREYFIKAKETKMPAISDLLVNQKTGKFIIVMAIPLLDGDKFLGTINCTVNPTILGKFSSDIKIGQTGLSYLWSETGTFIAHPKETHPGKKMEEVFTPEQVQAFKDTVFSNSTGTMEFINSEGIPKVAAYSTVPTTGWKVMVTMDTAEVYDAVSSFQRISLFILVAACVLVAIIAWFIGLKASRPLTTLSDALNQAATGDLTVRVQSKSRDEIGQISENMNSMLDSMSGMLNQASQVAEQVAASSEELTAISAQNVESARQIGVSTESVVSGSEAQSKAAQQNSAAMEEMASGIMKIAESASVVADTTLGAANDVKQGNEAVQQAVTQMSAIQHSVTNTSSEISVLGELSAKIGEIVNVISEIANQTQMLSLNASIEAARAGEHGKGFSVVADEVKKLAEQSKNSASNIAALIAEVQQTTNKAIRAMNEGVAVVDEGTKLMNHVGEVFETIHSSVQHVSEQIQEISAATEQISAGTQQVTSSMNEMVSISDNSFGNAQAIAAATEEQFASMEEISASSEALSKMAQELQEELQKFIIQKL